MIYVSPLCQQTVRYDFCAQMKHSDELKKNQMNENDKINGRKKMENSNFEREYLIL